MKKQVTVDKKTKGYSGQRGLKTAKPKKAPGANAGSQVARMQRWSLTMFPNIDEIYLHFCAYGA